MASTFRSPLILSMDLKASLRRLRYDLVRELVVLACSLVLVSLFFYIFQDFINIKVAELSPTLKQSLSQKFGLSCLLLSAVLLGYYYRSYDRNFANTCLRLGEQVQQIRIYLICKEALSATILYLLSWLIVSSLFDLSFESSDYLLVQMSMFALTLITRLLPKSKQDAHASNRLASFIENTPSKMLALLAWRSYQIVARNRASQLSLLTALLSVALIGLSSYFSVNFSIRAFLCIVSGLSLCAAIAFQVEEDLSHAWLEQSLGVTHQNFVKSYSYLTWLLSLFFSGLILVFTLFLDPEQVWSDSLKLSLLFSMASLLLPCFMLQIDGKRPVINLMTCFLVSLFISTGVLMHWLAILVFFIVDHYAKQYQSNAFYQYQ